MNINIINNTCMCLVRALISATLTGLILILFLILSLSLILVLKIIIKNTKILSNLIYVTKILLKERNISFASI